MDESAGRVGERGNAQVDRGGAAGSVLVIFASLSWAPATLT
jgi:hypothetical protein